jgi:DNA-binding GntR family transcriptional regulator
MHEIGTTLSPQGMSQDAIAGKLGIGPIQGVSRKERIAEAIRAAILSGRLAPGERIVEMRLAKELKVGNTAVREALFNLESRGFVKRIAHRGTFVTELSVEDAEQIFQVRRELEGLAVELLQLRVTEEDLEDLGHYTGQMREAAMRGDLSAFSQFDIDYHRTLWRRSGNKHLADALERIVLPLFAFFLMRCAPDSGNELLQNVERHVEVIAALRNRQDARRCMEESIDQFRRKKLKLLFNRERV